MTTTVRVVVSGRVQGVWYRAWTAQTASALGLDGWVRNRRDGSVEAVLSGEAAVVEAMIARLWDGPDLAAVSAVDRFAHDEPVAPGFAVKPTA
ncbi:MAG: acylphosphatase [Kiloniellaceae bacterium]